MTELVLIRKNAYYDSVTLMTLSNKLKKIAGVKDAMVAMASPMNKDLLENLSLANEEVRNSDANDLLIAIRAESQEICDKAYAFMDELLNSKGEDKKKNKENKYHTISEAKKNNKDLNLAIISVKGEFAAREARQAIANDMSVMLFSDNVTEEDELDLKKKAHEKGLLVMGPDCGTAIINGVGLCFANAVKKGNIGLVAASGTGLQEVTVLINNLGEGISQAIGTGGRDLSRKIGGIMMLDGLKLLEEDYKTKVIVLISKPPVDEVAEKIINEVKKCTKPVVICFIAGIPSMINGTNAIFAASLEDAAIKAVDALYGKEITESKGTIFKVPTTLLKEKSKKLKDNQKYIRGLYCGGTLASEAVTEMNKSLKNVYSNVAKNQEQNLEDPMKSYKHTIVDLGDDIFTVGKPHPMIEPELRNDRLFEDATNEETAVILMDFEIGYGSNADPVGVTIDTIKRVKKENEKYGREVIFIGYILGTQEDYQGFIKQKKLLEDEGFIVAKSNLHAVEMAIEAVKNRG